MAVSFVGASASGNSANATSVATTVPAGVASGDIAVAFLESWTSATAPTITPPTGFTQKGSTWSSGDGLAVNSTWWKRLTGADSGSYTFGVSQTEGLSRWNTVQVMVFRGCATSGDPFDAVATPVAGTFGSITSMSLTLTDGGGAQVFTVYNDTSGTHTPPTGFTEPAGVDVDCAACAYRLNGGSTGSVTVSGASISSSSSSGAWLGALLSDGGSPIVPPVVPTLVSDRGTVANATAATTSSVALTSPTTITVGNYLVARVAVDNSGTNGAAPGCTVTDPRSNTWTVLGPALSDPGAAAAGATAYLAYTRVVTAYQAADALTFNWGGVSTTAKAVVVEEWQHLDPVNPIAVTAVTANAAASSALTISITPTGANQMVYTCLATEGIAGDTAPNDTDTTNGSWAALTRTASANATATNNQCVAGAYKVVTDGGAQTWNATITARDWAALAVVFNPPPLPPKPYVVNQGALVRAHYW